MSRPHAGTKGLARGESRPREEGPCPSSRAEGAPPADQRAHRRGGRAVCGRGGGVRVSTQRSAQEQLVFCLLRTCFFSKPWGVPAVWGPRDTVTSTRMPIHPQASVAKSWEPKGGSNPNYVQSLKLPSRPPPGPDMCAPWSHQRPRSHSIVSQTDFPGAAARPVPRSPLPRGEAG